jgi:hypothetical protein
VVSQDPKQSALPGTAVTLTVSAGAGTSGHAGAAPEGPGSNPGTGSGGTDGGSGDGGTGGAVGGGGWSGGDDGSGGG